jgi:3',5'-cyclic AMP phosphodiesterase CpdA
MVGQRMIIDCISDLHGHYPKLEGGDLLVVAGDITKRDAPQEYEDFHNWLYELKSYKKVIVIPGNHDNCFQKNLWGPDFLALQSGLVTYLCDSGTEFEYYETDTPIYKPGEPTFDVHSVIQKKLKIWGSPWTKTFEGMNPHCKAFTCETEEELAVKFSLIPVDVDILVTHGPPYLMCDYRGLTIQEKKANFREGFGSKALYDRMEQIDDGRKRLLICGHIHEGYGTLNLSNMTYDQCTWKVINASHVNEHYEPVNKPIRVIL